MQFYADMHTHSQYSIDAKESIERMCCSAIEKGLKVLCITDHIDYNPNDEGFNYFKVDKCLKEINRFQKEFEDDLLLLSGIEFSEPHLYKKQLEEIGTYGFDVILGSIHWIDDQFIGQKELLGSYSLEEVEKRYYDSIIETLEYGHFDVLAHMDFPKRYYGHLSSTTQYVDQIIKLLIAKNIALEINTSSLRKGLGESMPSASIIERYVELGGNFLTMGSDAHFACDIAGDFNRAAGMLSAEAVKRIGFFSSGKFKLL